MGEVQIESIVVPANRKRRLGDISGLCESIREIGLINPITLSEDNVLICGLHRLNACRQLGWDTIPATRRSWAELDARIAELDENGARNDLTVLERSENLLERKQIYEAKYPQTKHGGSGRGRPKDRVADSATLSFAESTAAQTNISPRVVRENVQIAATLTDEQRDALRDTPVAESKTELLELVRERDPERRQEMVRQISSGESMSLKEARRKCKEHARDEQRRRSSAKALATPDPVAAGAQFSTILADPPWDWGDEGDVNQLGRAKPDYHTMGLNQLLEMPIPKLCFDDCHLYLWITNRSLPKGFGLLEAWGFRYVTMLTWPKPSFGMGNYFRGQTEHILFGVKGSQRLRRADASTLLPAWKRGPNGHSSKPVEIREHIESVSPGPYLEMFSRSEQRPLWVSWGSDAP